MFTLEKWKPLLTCNRCADYFEARRKIGHGILKAAWTLSQSRVTMTSQKLLQAEAQFREVLITLTKRFATLVCGHLNTTNVWEPAFMEMIMENPDKTRTILNQYIAGMKKAKSDASQNHTKVALPYSDP